MGYEEVSNHRSMVFDELRNDYYFNAIKKNVNKDSVVLDLGAGLGIIGFMALAAGAKKVYLVEPASISNITKMIIKANNLSEKVECISGKIEEIELPEKVDLITSVFTGNFLLSEDLLPSLFYARDKFLKSGGKLIPERAKMITVPVTDSLFYTKFIDCWSKTLYDVDFSLTRKFAVNSIYTNKPDKRNEKFLSLPIEILDLDFMTATEASCRIKSQVDILENGTIHGLVGWFDTKVGDKWLSTSPKSKQMHWRQLFLPLEQPVEIKKGEKIAFELHRPEYGEWSWIVEIQDKKEKHSTFLSKPLNPLQITKHTDDYRPKLSQNGILTAEILRLFDGKLSISEITEKIIGIYPEVFTNRLQASQYIKNLIYQYT